jgi:hypothetical protein
MYAHGSVDACCCRCPWRCSFCCCSPLSAGVSWRALVTVSRPLRVRDDAYDDDDDDAIRCRGCAAADDDDDNDDEAYTESCAANVRVSASQLPPLLPLLLLLLLLLEAMNEFVAADKEDERDDDVDTGLLRRHPSITSLNAILLLLLSARLPLSLPMLALGATPPHLTDICCCCRCCCCCCCCCCCLAGTKGC